ncbi:hypothetical protein EG829_12370 [bacterium]|nr:hypothetical protein [bacterium]
MQPTPLKAVHDRDLVALLETLGIRGRIQAGKVTCSQCHATVTMDNLGALYYDSGQVRVLCVADECIDSFRGA